MEDFKRPHGWSFRNNSVDFVHMQCLKESVSDWHELLKEACRVLKPGGWLQNVEYSSKVFSKNLRFGENCPNIYVMGLFTDEISKRSGCPLSVVEDDYIRPILNEVGFRVEDEITTACALSPSGLQGRYRDAALFAQAAFRMDIKGYLQRLLIEQLGWTFLMVSNLVERMHNELTTECSGPFDAYIHVQSILSQKRPPRGRKRSASSPLTNPRERRRDPSR
ncbi:hypothetical protein ANO14919_064980 [Xylariales sp. No.14919]|nr:hypothetical protein ANO14919_064980 [Xylariales sp. No.14919]